MAIKCLPDDVYVCVAEQTISPEPAADATGPAIKPASIPFNIFIIKLNMKSKHAKIANNNFHGERRTECEIVYAAIKILRFRRAPHT